MKKFKKLIALTCVAAMLVPTIAFAAEPETSGSFEGDGVVENNNAPALDVSNVVLPTTALDADAYDFKIDPEELFATTNPEKYTAGNADGVWFNAQTAAARLTIAGSGSTGNFSFAKKDWVEDASFNIFKGAFTAASNLDSMPEDTYAVWVPKADNKGEGEYVKLTKDTIGSYFNIDFGVDAGIDTMTAKQHTSKPNGDKIFNGKLYVFDWVPVTEEEAARDFYTPADPDTSTPATIAAGLFIKDVAGGTPDYTTAAALGTADKQCAYVEATIQNGGTSTAATVINKSTFDIKVTAKVTVNNANKLTFVDAQDKLDDVTTDASIYMAILYDTDKTAAVAGNADANGAYAAAPSATATMKLTGISTAGINFYQSDEVEDGTGSYKYYNYLNPVAESAYNSASFQIKAAVDAGDDWVAYTEAVKKAGVAPKINVVYSWEKVGTEITATTYSVSGSNAYSIAWAAGLSESNKTIKSITGGMSAEATNTFTFDSQAYVLSSDKNTLTIDGTKGPILSGAVGAKRYIKVTFGDDTSVVLELSVQQ